jgi:hypothetical protein
MWCFGLNVLRVWLALFEVSREETILVTVLRCRETIVSERPRQTSPFGSSFQTSCSERRIWTILHTKKHKFDYTDNRRREAETGEPCCSSRNLGSVAHVFPLVWVVRPDKLVDEDKSRKIACSCRNPRFSISARS